MSVELSSCEVCGERVELGGGGHDTLDDNGELHVWCHQHCPECDEGESCE